MPEPPGDPMPWKRHHLADPRRYVDHLACILGRRGALLLIVGVTWAAIGILEAVAPTEGHYALAAGWIVTGAGAAVHAAKPTGKDAVGWLAAYTMPAVKALIYASEFFLWLAPLGDVGDWRSSINAAVWVLVIGILLIVAGWDEAKPRPEREGR